jgi:hypothetical protein
VRQNGGKTAANQRPQRIGGRRFPPSKQLSEQKPFSFSFSLLLDEGGLREGWVDFAYSSPATAES